MTGSPSDYNVAALAKGLKVLSLFSEGRRELRAVEAAQLTNLPVPTVFRLLKTLEAEGFLEQLPDSRFVPTVAVLALGYAALRTVDVVEASEHPLRRLGESTGETVNLGILVDSQVLYLRRITGGSLVTANVQVGSRLPALGTSMGKVLLAYLPNADLKRRLRQLDYKTLAGPRAIKTAADLRKALTVVRTQGWSLQDEELAPGIRSVAAPVRDEEGSVVAAVNVAVNAAQASAEELLQLSLAPLLETVEEISARLGNPAPTPENAAPRELGMLPAQLGATAHSLRPAEIVQTSQAPSGTALTQSDGAHRSPHPPIDRKGLGRK